VYNDFVNKALENARVLQQTVADAATKGAEQAKPLVADAMAKAQELQKTIVDQAPQYGAAAQTHLQTATGHLTTFISTAQDVIAKGTASAQASLTPLAENARQAVHQAAKAVTEATAPKPPPAPPGG
jgi:F0F1-type ATP synthase membrane subunit b/b'